MQSRVQINVDWDSNPRIEVSESITDDARDRLLGQFRGKLGLCSNWAKIEIGATSVGSGSGPNGTQHWYIYPITPEEMEAEIKVMQERLDEYRKAGDNYPKPYGPAV